MLASGGEGVKGSLLAHPTFLTHIRTLSPSHPNLRKYPPFQIPPTVSPPYSDHLHLSMNCLGRRVRLWGQLGFLVCP